MTIPDKIKVGGKTYKVIYPYNYRERNDRVAHCDTLLDEIMIGADDGNGNKRTDANIIISLIHETLHAIDFDTGHKIFPENEAAIEGISHGIYQVLVDNPRLLELFREVK